MRPARQSMTVGWTSLVVAAGSGASPTHAPQKNVPCLDEDAAAPANGKTRQQVVAQRAREWMYMMLCGDTPCMCA